MRFFCSCFILLFYALQASAQQEELLVPGQNLFVNQIALAQNFYPFFNGSGMRVSVKEFGFDSADVDLLGRVLHTPDAPANLSTHANIMASLIGGAGNSDLAGRGVAPGCTLLSSSFVGLQPDTTYTELGISVQNHSYGVDIHNLYGAGARAYDQTTRDNPMLLHVFSAGNKGDSAALDGKYAYLNGFANLSGEFKMAKNILTVGAVDSTAQVWTLSSRGPAYDGRTKPDLVAYGYDGSSGAAALVSGAAAVLQQIALESGLPFVPSELTRVLLLNTTDDIGRPGPDFESGFGNLNLMRAVETTANQQYSIGTLSPGQVYEQTLTVPANLRQCKVSLAWNDPVAPVLAAKALIHDLDLSLIDPQGNEHLPWVLNTFPHVDSLGQAARRGRDTLNNAEQTTVDFPAAGVWRLRVKAPAGMTNDQPFALAWNWDTLQHFTWTYPVVNDPAPAGQEVILRWENNFPDSFARIEWRAWPAPEWRLVQDSVRLQAGIQKWILPDTFAEAQLRMLVDGKEFQSYIFMISRPLRMKIGFNCPDSVLLYWNAAHPDARYQLFGLGDRYMAPFLEISDTFVVLRKSAFPQRRFAVAPLTNWGDALGPRSAAPDIFTQGVECYFSNFLAELNDSNQVDLRLGIGTNYRVSKIFFDKMDKGSFGVINEQDADRMDYTFTDKQVQKGVNTYRPRLLLNNGALLTGDTVSIYYAGPNGYWVFPNPVAAGGTLQLSTRTDGEATFALYDILGRPVLSTVLEEVNERIPLDGVARGIYFFKIRNGEVLRAQGKIVVE